MPTRADVITLALRQIGVVAADETPSAPDADYAGDVLDGLFAELKAVHGFTWSWTLEATPQTHALPLALALGAEIGNTYGVATTSKASAIGRLRALSFPDDREDRRDTDEDGVISDAEKDAGMRAVFY